MNNTWASWHEVAIAPPEKYTRLTYVDHPDNCDVYGNDNGKGNPGRFVPFKPKQTIQCNMCHDGG